MPHRLKSVTRNSTAVLLGTAVLLWLSACISTPVPTPLPQPSETRLPASTPAIRTAPTLPPEWTKTFTPTATFTPTDTPTSTPTPLLSEAEVCAGMLFDLTEADGMQIRSDEGLTFLAGIVHEDAIVRFLVRRQGAGEDVPPEEGSLPGGESYAMTFGFGLEPGIYDWTVTVSTSIYTDICQQRGTFETIPPAPTATPDPFATPQRSLLQELLDVVTRRMVGTPPTPYTPTFTPTPAASPSGSPVP